VQKQPITKTVPDDAIDAVAINWCHMLKNGYSIEGVA
jgi:Holliday junction resolvasome RuvABC endonuclease subunit